MMNALKAADRCVGLFCKYMSIALLLVLFALLGSAIVLRWAPVVRIDGYDEIVELLFVWIIVLTVVALWREGTLYRVALVEHLLPPRGQFVLELLINGAMLFFALILVVYGWQFAASSGETTPFLRLDKAYWYAALPIGGVFMTIYSVIWIYRVIRGKTLDQSSTLIS